MFRTSFPGSDHQTMLVRLFTRTGAAVEGEVYWRQAKVQQEGVEVTESMDARQSLDGEDHDLAQSRVRHVPHLECLRAWAPF